MPLYKVIQVSDRHKVAVWKIDEDVNDLVSALKLSESDKDTFERFKIDRRKKEWLATRILLQKLIGEYPAIVYGSNGKPRLANQKYYIGISHTTNYAAVSVSDNPTALDIELCTDRVKKVANRFVHKAEESYIRQEQLKQYLTVLWSAKETLYKFYNVYGVIFKEQFKVSPFELKERGELHCEFIFDEKVNEIKLTFDVNHEYTLVYC